jgi:hypothetical protein
MASLFSQKLINVCFGSLALLGLEKFDQVIFDFDLKDKTFTFVVREELNTDKEHLRELIVNDGYVFQKPKNEE